MNYVVSQKLQYMIIGGIEFSTKCWKTTYFVKWFLFLSLIRSSCRHYLNYLNALKHQDLVNPLVTHFYCSLQPRGVMLNSEWISCQRHWIAIQCDTKVTSCVYTQILSCWKESQSHSCLFSLLISFTYFPCLFFGHTYGAALWHVSILALFTLSHAHCPGCTHNPITHSVKVSYIRSFSLLNTHDLKFVISYRCSQSLETFSLLWARGLSPTVLLSQTHTHICRHSGFCCRLLPHLRLLTGDQNRDRRQEGWRKYQ